MMTTLYQEQRHTADRDGRSRNRELFGKKPGPLVPGSTSATTTYKFVPLKRGT
jgi:hypothetical protein